MDACLKLTLLFSNSIEVAKLPQRLLAGADMGADELALS
jgi:hypothetical protein